MGNQKIIRLKYILSITPFFVLGALLFAESDGALGADRKANTTRGVYYSSDPVSPHIWNIGFKGNKSFTKLVLRDVVAVQPPSFWKKLIFWRPSGLVLRETALKKDVIRLRRFYKRRGFDDVKVRYRVIEKDNGWKKKVIFVIEENKPLIIRNLNIRYQATREMRQFLAGQHSYNRALQRQPFHEGRRYATINRPDVKGKIVPVLRNLGFAYADMEIMAKVDSASHEASLTFVMKPGPRTVIDSIRVTGKYSVSPALIQRNSGLVRGEYFSEKKLQEAQRELFNHPLFRFATISIPEQPKDTTLTLMIRVREHKTRSIGIKAGVGREDIIRGQVNWTHRNVAHKGHRFTATAYASFIEQQLSANYLFPYVFNENSSFLINPFAQHLLESNFELFQIGLNNSLIYQYSRNMTGSISYEFTRNFELTRSLNVDLPDTARDYNISAVQLSGYYTSDLQQDKGWVIRPYLEISGFLGSASFDFQKFVIDLRRYIKLNKTTTLAGRVKAGSIFYPENDSLPNQVRFYGGGTNSVRGWDRHMLGPKRAVLDEEGRFKKYVPVGGRAVFTFNLELRKDLDSFIDGLGMAVFMDGGQVWRRIDKTDNRPIRYAAGGGIRYESPIGPVRVDVGYKLNPSSRDLDRYRGRDFGNYTDYLAVHFSIGQSF